MPASRMMATSTAITATCPLAMLMWQSEKISMASSKPQTAPEQQKTLLEHSVDGVKQATAKAKAEAKVRAVDTRKAEAKPEQTSNR